MWGARLARMLAFEMTRQGATAMITRALRAAVLSAAVLLTPGASAFGAAGEPDPSFSDDGRVVLPANGVGRDALVQPDGRVVVAGSTTGGQNFGVWRFDSDGSPDDLFDGDGSNAVDFGGRDELSAVALQPDGKIVVAGFTVPGNGTQSIAIARFNANGSLDRSFNPGGTQPGTKILPTSAKTERAYDVVAQPDGRLVLVGSSDTEYLVVRLDDAGAPDGTSWELDGTGGLTHLDQAALQPDGKLVAAGAGGVARFNPGGALDKTFGTTGIVPRADPESVDALVLQPDGKIVVAGSSNSADSRMVVARLTAEGPPDPAFSDDGIASPDFPGQEAAAGLALQDDGKLLVAGTTSSGYDFAVARLDESGVLDPSYGAGGRTTIPFDENVAAGDAVLQPDGRLVISGATETYGLVVARLLADPAPGEPQPEPDPDPDPQPTPQALCAGATATIVGTRGADVLRGTPGADVIAARGGNDRVVGARGNDVVCGGGGRDRLSGGRGADVLLAGAGRDRCIGGPARDRGRGCEKKRSL
jgi:uncharacterized delta-60 repeat protein